MNKSFLLGFLIVASTAHAEIETVPLDMELGHWETNAEMLQSDAMER